MHEALEAIVKFFLRFNEHVNNMGPEIKRTYSLDARTTYTRLRWQGATLDYRKQGLSESALLASAMFRVNLCAPERVPIKRPWHQIEALKKELQHLRLRALEDLDEMSRRPKQEWLVAHLAPDFPVQLMFHGNYDQFCIDVTGRNLEAFGVTTFRLDAEDVTPKLMDEIGLFLLGRTNRLPAALRRV